MAHRSPLPRARLTLDEVDCVLLDATLLLTFDDGELSNLLGPERQAAPGRTLVDRLHARCHRDGALARQVQAALDLVHGRAVRDLEAMGVADLGRALLARDLWAVDGLAGWLWALATTPGASADAVRAAVRRALVVDGLRSVRARRA